MADDEVRAAERAWRSNPGDQPALARYVEARRRAGLPVGHELLDASNDHDGEDLGQTPSTAGRG